jgi:two-component system, chemotaxis family, sensor kinase CheA
VSGFSDERSAELREIFFDSAQELLQSLNDEALKLEKVPGDLETVRSIRRIVHTLKGDAAACGFRELSNAAHELEDALALESLSSHLKLAEIAFTAADTFGAMVGAYRGQKKPPSAEPLRKMIKAMIKAMAEGPPGRKRWRKKQVDSVAPAAWSEYEHMAITNAQALGKHVYSITAEIDPHCAMPIAASQLLLKALASLGEVLGTRPEAGSAQNPKSFEILLSSEKSAEQIAAKCRIPTVIGRLALEPIKEAQPKTRPKTRKIAWEKQESAPIQAVANENPVPAADELQAAAPHSGTGVTENILRVDAERIDNVLNLVGELIIGKSMLQQVLNEFARRFPKDTMRARLGDALAFQARVLGDLQRSVMKIRMVPVEQLFRRFPRLVRDVARQCGKEVELVVRGEDTELDKSLLDAIAEPMNHLVRNAVSHGIENASERTQNGKPATGTLQLSAHHQGNQIIIEVSDDGRGIDAQRVKAKAVEKGLLTPEEAERLTEPELLNLLFRPGFSTADEITEIAGRGVGLDVVETVLERLKGSIEIRTRSGEGTTFRLKLPLTLAIIKALLFRVEQRLYAIPLNAVAEISRALESELHQVDNYEVLQLRNQVLPLVRLGNRGNGPAEMKKVFVLVIHVGERKLGLMVDALEGEEELVIKALDDQTVATELISGASILGDGRVVLIVNLPAIIERHSKSRPQQAGAVAAGLLASHQGRPQMAKTAPGVQS